MFRHLSIITELFVTSQLKAIDYACRCYTLKYYSIEMP